MLARLQCGGDVLVGGVQTAHHLRHDINAVVMEDILEIMGGDIRDLGLFRANEDAADVKILPVAAPLVYAAAHHAEAQ